jgi:hypothetical protein
MKKYGTWIWLELSYSSCCSFGVLIFVQPALAGQSCPSVGIKPMERSSGVKLPPMGTLQTANNNTDTTLAGRVIFLLT